MLNLALMTLSSSSLERRIVAMRSGAAPAVLAQCVSVAATLGLLVGACSAGQPSNPAPARYEDADINHVRDVVVGELNGKLENRHQYWAFFNADWTLERVDAGAVGAVEMPAADVKLLGLEADERIPKPYYDVAQSLINKEPRLAMARMPGWPIYGSVQVIAGNDTAVINWGHLAN